MIRPPQSSDLDTALPCHTQEQTLYRQGENTDIVFLAIYYHDLVISPSFLDPIMKGNEFTIHDDTHSI